MLNNFIFTIIICILSTIANGGELVESGVNGSINWTEGIVYAKGMGPIDPAMANNPRGKLIARRIAVVDCQRNLLELVKGVRVTSTTLVRNLMIEKDTVQTTISGIIKNAEVVKENYDKEEGILYITMKMPFSGKFMDTVIEDKMLNTKNWSDIIPIMFSNFFPISEAFAAQNHDYDFKPDEKNTIKKIIKLFEINGYEKGIEKLNTLLLGFDKFDDYSGVVINALGISGFRPALCARLRQKNGKVVYPGNLVKKRSASSSLFYSWNDNLEEAKGTKRVTHNPIIIKAEDIYKQQRSDLIISDENAKAILLMANGGNVLKKCRIVIVTK